VIGVDTNILVRYLTKDDEQQWEQAVKIIEGGEQCFIANIVLCELVWVLRAKPYQFSKEEISNTIEMMLQCAVFELENRSVVYQALQRFKQGRADFSDYLIGAIAQQSGCSTTATFDRKLRGDKGFDCLES
jgi:predicted nucleic-acid-binding protein